ncbi:PIN-like domain-containing protein [Lacticaseibacillus saniviri]
MQELYQQEIKENAKHIKEVHGKSKDLVIAFMDENSNNNYKNITKSWISEVEKEGELRYKNMISPGYSDSKNKGNGTRADGKLVYHTKFGDLLIWKDTLRYLKESKKNYSNVIFVTRDGESSNKVDLYLNGKVENGPAPSLKGEIAAINRDAKFHIINLEKLLSIVAPDEEIKIYYTRAGRKINIQSSLREQQKPRGVFNQRDEIDSGIDIDALQEELSQKVLDSGQINDALVKEFESSDIEDREWDSEGIADYMVESGETEVNISGADTKITSLEVLNDTEFSAKISGDIDYSLKWYWPGAEKDDDPEMYSQAAERNSDFTATIYAVYSASSDSFYAISIDDLYVDSDSNIH